MKSPEHRIALFSRLIAIVLSAAIIYLPDSGDWIVIAGFWGLTELINGVSAHVHPAVREASRCEGRQEGRHAFLEHARNFLDVTEPVTGD